MRAIYKRAAAYFLIMAVLISSAGCSKKVKKEPKPKPKATAVVDNGNTDAKGKGEGQSDVPLIIGCGKIKKKFNPFVKKNDADKQAVDLTQIYLLGNDRSGEIIYHGIDGEVKDYNGNSYTYYGPADVDVNFNDDKNETLYTITLRDDLMFNDGVPVNIDDVIFTMYVLCDKDYKGDYKLGLQNIRGLSKYRKGKAKKIAGIRRINDYKMTVALAGYDKNMIYALQIPICPLHYYGDVSKYNPKKNKFGFKRGDISAVCANKSSPVGAGAYRFVKYEKGIIYYTSNEIYYKGCPKIAYVQIKEMTSILKAASNKIEKAIKAEQEQAEEGIEGQQDNKEERTPVPEGALNHNAEAMEMSEGTMDIIDANLTVEDLFWISYVNSNGEISGNKIDTQFISEGSYQYLGINASNVKVGNNPISGQSKNLRRAFAVAASAFKSDLYEYYKEGTQIIEYPYLSSLWLTPKTDDEGYSKAYITDINGNELYDEDTDPEEKYEQVKEAVLGYLKAAGYTISSEGEVMTAPRGAHMSYSVMIAGGAKNSLYQLVSDMSKLFEKIGMRLNILPVNSERLLKNKLSKGKQQLWAGSCDVKNGYWLEGRYTDNNGIFGIRDNRLAKFEQKANIALTDKKLKKLYVHFFERVRNITVEVPINEFKTAVMYSSARIDMDTMTKDITLFYSWSNDIENIEMK